MAKAEYLTLSEVFALALTNSRLAIVRYQLEAEPLRVAEILTAIARKESNFNILAKNAKSSATGLMQILSGTQTAIEKRLGIPKKSGSARLDGNYAMFLAAHEFCYQLQRYDDDLGKAIIAYNQGSFGTKQLKNARMYLADINKYLVNHRPEIENIL